MKTGFFQRIHFIVLLFTALAVPLYAQQDFLNEEWEDHLETFIDRADAARNQEEWLRITQNGMESVMADWESAIRLVYTDPDIVEEEKTALSGQLEEKLSEALVNWVVHNFERNIESVELSAFWADVRDDAAAETLQIEDGAPVLDEAGDYVINVLSGEDWGDAVTEFESRWTTEVQERLDDWYQGAEASYADILPMLSDEQRAELEESQGFSLDTLRDSQAREMFKILHIVQSEMARYRLRDVYSLRLKSEAETASAQTHELIQEVKTEIEGSLDHLRNGLNTGNVDASVDEAEIDAVLWQQSFQEELEKGLLQWDEAEEKLLVSRSEWEQQAGLDLAQAQEVWGEAQQELVNARNEWLRQYQEVLTLGRERWENQSRELQNALDAAEVELTANIEARKSSLQERGESLVDLLGQSLQMLSTARSNYAYWLNKTNSAATLDIDDVPWDLGEMRELYVRERSSSSLIGPLHSDAVEDAFTGSGDISFRRFSFNLRESLKNNDQLKLLGTEYLDSLISDVKESFGPDGWPEDVDLKDFNARIHLKSQDLIEDYVTAKLALLHSSLLDEKRFPDHNFVYYSRHNAYYYEGRFFDASDYNSWKSRVVGEINSLATTELEAYLKYLVDAAFPSEMSGDLEQAVYWLDEIFVDYKSYAQEAEADLYATYNLTVFGESGVDEEGLLGPIGALEDGSWEELFLDDYQVELLKARAVEGYWKKELEVAQAVLEYAEDESSGRDTQAETQANYEESLAEYEAALTAYQESIAELEVFNGHIDANREDIAEVQGELSRLKEELAQAQTLYQNQLLLLELQSPVYYQEQMRDAYLDLRTLAGLTDDDSLSIASGYADYLSALENYGGEALLKSASSSVYELVTGVTDNHNQPSVLSLLDLKARYDAASAWNSQDYMEGNQINFNFLTAFAAAWNLDNGDTEYKSVELLLRGYGNTSQSNEAAAGFLNALDVQTGELLRIYRAELEDRLARISWFAYGDEDFSGNAGDSESEIEAKFEADADTALGTLISQRLNYDLSVLERLQTEFQTWVDSGNDATVFSVAEPTDFNDGYAVLSWIYVSQYGGDSLGSQLNTDIASLQEMINSALDDTSSLGESIQTLLTSNNLAVLYLNGVSLFVQSGRDQAARYMRDELAAYDDAIRRKGRWIDLKNSVPGNYARHRDETIREIKDFFIGKDLAIEVGEDWSLSHHRDIWENGNFTYQEEVVDYLSGLTLDLEEIQRNLSAHRAVSQAVWEWTSDLEDYFFVMAQDLDSGSLSADTQADWENLNAEDEILGEKFNWLEQLGNTQELLISLSLLNLIDGDEIHNILIEALASELANGFAVSGADFLDPSNLESYDFRSGMNNLYGTLGLNGNEDKDKEVYTVLEGVFDAAVAGAIALIEDAVAQAKSSSTSLEDNLYVLKKAAYEGVFSDDYIFSLLNGEVDDIDISLSTEEEEELNDFLDMLNLMRGYDAVIHGDFESYLESQGYLDNTKPLMEQAWLLSLQDGFWDDEFFSFPKEVALTSDDKKNEWIRNKLNAHGNRLDIALRHAVLLHGDTLQNDLYTQLDDIDKRANRLYYVDAFFSFLDNIPGDYLLYQTPEYFILKENEYWVSELSDLEEDVADGILTQEELDGMRAIQEPMGESDELGAALTESDKNVVSSANRFIQALSSWSNEAIIDESLNTYREDFESLVLLDALGDWGDIDDAIVTAIDYTIDSTIERKLDNSYMEWLNRVSAESSIKSAMNTFGESIDAYYAAKGGSITSYMTDALEKVEEVNAKIAGVEEDWKALIGEAVEEGSDEDTLAVDGITYREAEYLYSRGYRAVQDNLDALDEAKQAYKVAKAIRDYASSGYLNYSNSEEDLELFEENGRSDDLAILRGSIDAVDPQEHYDKVNDNYRNSLAILSTLEEIYSQDGAYESFEERDEEYRDHLENVDIAKRDEIALINLEGLLKDFADDIQVQYEEAQKERNKYFNDNFFFGYNNEEDFEKIFTDTDRENRLLRSMTVEWDEEGKVSISFLATNEDDNFLIENAPGRLDRLKQFFGLKDMSSKNQTYKDMLESTLAQVSTMSKDDIASWYKSITFENMRYWENTDRSIPYRNLAAWSFFGDTPYEDNEQKFGYFFKEIDGKLYSDFKKNLVDNPSNEYQFFKFIYWANPSSGAEFSFRTAGAKYVEYEAYRRTTDRMDNFWSFLYINNLRSMRRRRNERKDIWNDNVEYMMIQTDAYAAKVAQAEYLGEYLADLNGENGATPEILYELLATAIYEGPSYRSEELADFLGIEAPDLNDVRAEWRPTKGTVSRSRRGWRRLKRFSASDIRDDYIERWKDLLATHFGGLAAQIDSQTLATAETSGDVLTLLLGKSGRRKKTAEEALGKHLYDDVLQDGESMGIAVDQAAAARDFTKKLEAFKANGLLPVDDFPLETAQTLVDNLDSEDSINALMETIDTYLANHGEENHRLQMYLAEALTDYRKWASDEGEVERAALALGRLKEVFSVLIDAYHNGEAFLEAAQNAWYQSQYSQREDLRSRWDKSAELFEEVAAGSLELFSIGSQYQQPELLAGLQAAYDARMAAYKEVRQAEWATMVLEENVQKRAWEEKMHAILNRGLMEWQLATYRLNAKQRAWEVQYQEDFNTQVEGWNAQYLVFLDKKHQWVTDITDQAVRIGDNEVLKRFGNSTKNAIADASHFVMAQLPPLPSLDNLMENIIDKQLLSNIIGGAEGLRSSIGAVKPIVFTQLGSNPYSNSELLDKIRSYQTEQNDELSARMALVQYEQLLDTFDEAVGGLEEKVEDANDNMATSMRKMFVNGGFRVVGKNYVKKTLVAATLWENKYDTHTILGYQDYDLNLKDFSGDLAPSSESMIIDLGARGIQALLDRALKSLDEEQERIFGGESTYIDRGAGDSDASLSLEEYMELAQEDNAEGRYISLSGGDFNYHVGYAPTFKNNPNSGLSLGQWKSNVRYEGLGEQGRLIGMYMQHQLIQSAGEAEFNKPVYEQKLWDDRGMQFKAISLRTANDIANAVAASIVTAATFGAGTPLLLAAVVVTAMSMADDLFFTIADVGMGYKEADDAWGAFGQKTATTFVTSLAGYGFNGVPGSEVATGLVAKTGEFGASVWGSTLMKGAEVFTKNMATSTISAMDITSIGSSDFWNNDVFMESAFGVNAWAGLASSMTGTFVTNGLNDLALEGYLNDSYTNGSVLNSTLGTGASVAVEYGIAKSSTVNLLSFSDLFLPFDLETDWTMPSTGLFEMRLGKGAPAFTFGTGGHSLGVEQLLRSGKGLDIYWQNLRVANSENVDEAATVGMRTLYSSEDKDAKETPLNDFYEKILSGEKKVTVDKGQEYQGRTDSSGDTTVIDLNLDGFGALDLGVLLAHEAQRDGYDSGEAEQDAELRRAVFGHMYVSQQLAAIYGYDSLNAHNAHEAKLFSRAMATGNFDELGEALAGYDNTGDFWKLMDDGSIEWDGSHDLSNEEGELLLRYMGPGTGDPRKSLAWFLGYDNLDAGKAIVNQIMVNAGWSYVDGQYKVGDGGQQGLDIGDTLSSRLYYGVHKDSVFTFVQEVAARYEDPAVANEKIQGIASQMISNEFIDKIPSDIFTADRLRYASLLSSMSNFLLNNGVILNKDFDAVISQKFEESEASPNYPKAQEKGFHNGVDIAGEERDAIADQPLFPGWSGEVADARWSDFVEYETKEAWSAAIAAEGSQLMFDDSNGAYVEYSRGYGNSVMVNYGFDFESMFIPSGVSSLFAHMYDISVENGQRYDTDTPLGTVGSSGASSGAHIHHEFFTPKRWGESNIFSDFYGLSPLQGLTGGNYFESKIFYDPEKIWNELYGVFEREEE